MEPFNCIMNNSIKHQSFVYTQLNGLSSIWLRDGTLTSITTSGQSGPESNDSTFPEASELEPRHQIVLCHIQDTCWGAVSPPLKMQLAYSTAPPN